MSAEKFGKLFLLDFCAPYEAHERRIAHHVTAFARGQHVVPIYLQRVAVADRCPAGQRDARIVQAERLIDRVVRNMVRHPHRDFRDHGGKLFVLDAVELIDRDPGHQFGIDPLVAIQRLQAFQFEPPDLAIGDDEEIAAAAGRVEKAHPGQAGLELQQRLVLCRPARFQPFQLLAQLVEEERADYLQDVLLAGVMRALRPPLLRVHHGLEQAAEDRRADGGPVVAAGVEQVFAHRRIEDRRAQVFAEQSPVDIGEG